MADHFVFSLLLIVIAQATILLILRLKDAVQIKHPSASDCTGPPDSKKFQARSLAPTCQDGDVIHGRPRLDPLSRATIEWYLDRGASSRFQAYFRPEDN